MVGRVPRCVKGLEAELGALDGVAVGEYEIESKVGQGGFGTVYRAVHPLIGKVVAVPHILGHLSLKPAHALAFPITALILLGMGLGIGALGSGLPIRRFLRV